MRYEENPFNILHVSMRDSQDKILDKVEDLSLTLDEALCSQAASILTNPTKRLEAEVSWFPGYTPKKVKEAFEDAKSAPDEFIDNLSADNLSYADVNAEILAFLNIPYPTMLESYLLKIASDLEDIDTDALLNELNKERNAAGIPSIPNIDVLTTALHNRQKELSEIIYSFLKGFGRDKLVDILTSAIEESTDLGELESEALLLQLIEKYEVDIQSSLEEAASKVEQQITFIRDSADKEINDGELNSAIDTLDSLLKAWDRLAQPIQVSMQSQGLEHAASKAMASSVRQLALYLYNEHNLLDTAKRITELMQSVFAEVLTVAEKADEDISILNNINDKDQIVYKASKECKKCMEEVKRDSTRGYAIAEYLHTYLMYLIDELLINNAPQRVSSLTDATYLLTNLSDLYLNAMLQCIMSYGNATKEWKKCQRFIARKIIYPYRTSDQVQVYTKILNTAYQYESIILNNIQVQKGYEAMNPFFDMPSFRSILGCGFKLYGYSDPIEIDTGMSKSNPRYPNATFKETTYVTTHCFALFNFPVFPLARYRISEHFDGKIRFYGKLPLTIGNKIHILISLVVLLFCFMAIFSSDSSKNKRSKKTRYSYIIQQEYNRNENSQKSFGIIDLKHPI